MFFIPLEEDEQQFALKPMNCPGHMLLFGSTAPLATASCRSATPSRRRSTATSSRGTLHGLLRVRHITQDDAHIFCTPRADRGRDLRLPRLSRPTSTTSSAWRRAFELSTRPGEQARHRRGVGLHRGRARGGARAARDRLRRQRGRRRVLRPEDRPPHDRRRSAAPGRWGRSSSTRRCRSASASPTWAPTTREHTPYVIHRALLGSLERFIGILIEHYGGAFPFWLAPVQVRVLPVGEGHPAAPRAIGDAARASAGYRVDVGEPTRRSASGSGRAELEKIPFMIVFGDKESEASLAVRERGGEPVRRKSLARFPREACYA